MKKIHCFLVAFLLIASCKSIIVRDGISDGTWMVGDLIYTAAYVKQTDTGKALTATDLNSNGLNFYFYNYPQANGIYNIVNNPQQANEVAIVAIFQDTTRAYLTTGADNKTAKVSFSDGKMTIRVPSVEAKNVYEPDDKISLQANLTEK